MAHSYQRIIPSLLTIFFAACSSCFAQISIKGQVLDKTTKEPLELAIVMDSKTGKNTLTDRMGNFILKNETADCSIKITFIGYTSQLISIKNNNNQLLTIQLEKGMVDLQQVIITSHSNSITSCRTFSNLDLNMKPAKSAQDLLRLVPGLFIAQQVGGGKAEKIFLRGFDADHGTDVSFFVDGIPINMVSHAHGQGYADLHFLIPETVANYEFGKGPYYANRGDFTTAGYVAYNTISVLDHNTVKLEAGQFNTGRVVAMIDLLSSRAKEKGQSAYVAGETLYTDGPFDLPGHFHRYNLLSKFNTSIGGNSKLSLIFSTFSSQWRASGEIPNRAVSEGYIHDRFGVIDSSQGGSTSRTNVIAKLTTSLKNNLTWENQAYYSHYFFNLITNFTFYYVNPVEGDEFNQHENRDLFGYSSKLSRQSNIGSTLLTSSASIGIRYDQTHPSWLAHTLKGEFLNYLQLGNIHETNLNGYIDETLENGNWLVNVGARLDYLHFYYQNSAPASDTVAALYIGKKSSQQKAVINHKINIQYTVNSQSQIYFKAGKGFHSNDVRVVIANEGYQILPAAYGLDFGVNWKPLPHLFINVAVWYLYLQQEFTYGSDYGKTSIQPGGKTGREGLDLSARIQFNCWLFGDMNIDLAKPRALNVPKGTDYLPTAPTFTSTAGLYYRLKNGLNGGISYRYLHDRPANSDYSIKALGYFITDFTANYSRKKFEIGVSIENLTNQSWSESELEYVSRLKSEGQSADEISYIPGIPFFAKLKFSIFF